MARGIQAGDKAPDFTLPAQNGAPVKLSDRLAQRVVVLYFYPKDETSGCTAEACAFRDSYEDFKQAGADVIGVSTDGGKAHERFTKKHNLPFTLLTDEGGAVARLLGVKRAVFGLVGGRETFVIDRSGIIRH